MRTTAETRTMILRMISPVESPFWGKLSRKRFFGFPFFRRAICRLSGPYDIRFADVPAHLRSPAAGSSPVVAAADRPAGVSAAVRPVAVLLVSVPLVLALPDVEHPAAGISLAVAAAGRPADVPAAVRFVSVRPDAALLVLALPDVEHPAAGSSPVVSAADRPAGVTAAVSPVRALQLRLVLAHPEAVAGNSRHCCRRAGRRMPAVFCRAGHSCRCSGSRRLSKSFPRPVPHSLGSVHSYSFESRP